MTNISDLAGTEPSLSPRFCLMPMTGIFKQCRKFSLNKKFFQNSEKNVRYLKILFAIANKISVNFLCQFLESL